MTGPLIAAAVAGASLASAPMALVAARRRPSGGPRAVRPAPMWLVRARRAVRTGPPTSARRRLVVWSAAGAGVWVVSGWPVAGVALAVAGAWLPWLLGSARVVQERLATVEALEAWCRRMADTLSGGGAIGLAQAIVTTASRVDDPIASAVQALARRLQSDRGEPARALREFAETVDDRVGDAVAAALMLALHQQSVGVADVLRQLADGVARDVRARRDIEASRAESRQSIRMLLVIQVGLLVLLALVPSFAAPYGTPVGQVVMALLLAATAGLLVWMRRLSLGRRPPRFLGDAAGAP